MHCYWSNNIIAHCSRLMSNAYSTGVHGPLWDTYATAVSSTSTTRRLICRLTKLQSQEQKKHFQVHEILRTADRFGWAVGIGVLYDYLPWTSFLFKKQLNEWGLRIERAKQLTSYRVEALFEHIKHQSQSLAAKNFRTWDGVSTRTLADFLQLAGKVINWHLF